MCIKSQILKEIFKVPCGNALLPSGHNVTSTNTGEAAIIRQPEEHSGLSGAAPGFFAGGGRSTTAVYSGRLWRPRRQAV